MHFNLSHAGALAFAVLATMKIGADVEQLRADFNWSRKPRPPSCDHSDSISYLVGLRQASATPAIATRPNLLGAASRDCSRKLSVVDPAACLDDASAVIEEQI
jgi:hypothetical protein